jgi:hypothetical protein
MTSLFHEAMTSVINIRWVLGTPSLGTKRPEREADHSLQLVPRSKNEWSYTSTAQYTFIAWCSAKKSTGTTLTKEMPLMKLQGKGVPELN